MPTSCKLTKPNPDYWHLFHDLFLKKESEYDYETIDQEDGTKLKLKFYVTPIIEEGRMRCACAIDTPFYAFSREKGRVVSKSTIPVYLRVYKLGLGNLLGIFAPKWITPRITFALAQIAKTTDSNVRDFVNPVMLKLHSREKELQNEFIDVRRLWLKDIPDPNVKGAAFGGLMLQDTPEYERYVRQMGGRIEAIAFKWEGVTILLSSNGSIFTYASLDEAEASEFFQRIISRLVDLGVVS